MGSIRAIRLARAACALGLAIPAALFFVWSVHWPLVGDASLIHYIAFLIERGWVPYRRLGDMNMPGSFLIELAAMRFFGMGDLGWRLFDFTLMLTAAASFWIICRHPTRAPSIAVSSRWVGSSRGSFATLFATCLFIVIHGRDGLAEGGQRDLTMAVCLLAGTAFLFLAVRRGSTVAAVLFGLLSGIALTIKPTAALLSVAQLVLAAQALHGRGRPWLRTALIATASASLAPALCLAFLLREQALASFLAGFHGILPYYASLGHRPVSFLLLHSVSPLLPVVILWLPVLCLLRPAITWTADWERTALRLGVLFGFVSCVIQARGLPYYRYPLLAFLLPLIVNDCEAALASGWPGKLRTRAGHTLALLTLATGSLIVAPQSALVMHRFRPREIDFIATLQQHLVDLGGPALSGRIQCIDSISGCGNVLYRMRLEPATGVLSDFLLFGPANVPIIRQTREEFSQAILTRPPRVIVVTSHLHIDGPDQYEKLSRWPAFTAFLAANYTLATEWSPTRTARWWSREETPAGYRIYVLRAAPR